MKLNPILNHLLDDVNYQKARRLVSCFTKLARKEDQRVFSGGENPPNDMIAGAGLSEEQRRRINFALASLRTADFYNERFGTIAEEREFFARPHLKSISTCLEEN